MAATTIGHAIILEGEPFDWAAVQTEIERGDLWNNSPHRAAAIADPGLCSCPRCHVDYWREGVRQRCPACQAEYETDWWCMLSWGVQSGRRMAKGSPLAKTDQRYFDRSAVFRWGVEHPDCSLDTRVVFTGTDWIAVWSGAISYERMGGMVGGKVIGIVRGEADTLLNVEDNGPGRSDVCAIRCVEHDDERVAVGDSVWWQADKVYWTPTRFRRTETADQWRDVPLAKVGYSH